MLQHTDTHDRLRLSYADLYAFARTAPSGIGHSHDTGSLYGGGPTYAEWTGTPDYNTATRLLRTGDAKRAQEIARLSGVFTRTYADKIRRQELVWAEEGDTFDVARVLTGEPEAWIQWQSGVVVSPRYIEIVASVAYACSISTEVIARRGAAICSLIRLCEHAGYRTRVIARRACRPSALGTVHVVYDVTVKEYTQPLDIARIAFVFCHPAFMRRIIFAVDESYPGLRKSIRDCAISGTYGYPTTYSQEQGHVHLGALTGQLAFNSPWVSKEATDIWLRKIMKKHGIKLT